MTKKNIERRTLYQHWVHSHEEDTETEIVYRPASFRFPRSRGRSAFILKPDNGLVEIGIGPTDRRQEGQGTWELKNDDTLLFYEEAQTRPKRTVKIVMLDKDRLVLRK